MSTDNPITEEEREILDNHSLNPTDKCPQCEDTWLECLRDDECRVNDSQYSYKLEKMVCFYCYESNQSYISGTVIVFEPHRGEVTKWTVSTLEDLKWTCRHEWFDEVPDFDDLDWEFPKNCEMCPIQFTYIRSDAWRGRYEAKADDWVTLHEDGILAYSSNEQKLKTFSDLVLRLLWHANVNFAIIIGRSSNVFYSTYEIKTEGDISDDLKGIMRALKNQYRDPNEYSLTAWTGKSDDYTEADRKFAAYAERIMNGNPLAEILEEIQGLTE